MLNNPQRNNLNFGVVKSAGDNSLTNVFGFSTPADFEKEGNKWED